MMNETTTKHDDGGPAFPQNDATVNRINNEAGMSLRDWFAGQVLMGLCADSNYNRTTDGYAEGAYVLADAMLAARTR